MPISIAGHYFQNDGLVATAYISNCLIMSRGLLVHVNGDNNTLFLCQPNIIVNILVRFYRYFSYVSEKCMLCVLSYLYH